MIKAKVAKLLGPHELVFDDEPIDESLLASDEVLCKTIASAISPGTEIAAYNGTTPLRPMKAFPRLIGYCNVAEIIKIGSDITEYNVGQRILTFSSHRSHFVIKSKEILSIIPDGVSSQLASTAYIYHLGYNAILNSKIKYGSSIVVIGLGVIGLCSIGLSKMAGAEVYGITNHELPKQKALEMGAIEIFSRKEIEILKSKLGRKLADAVITTSNDWNDWKIALDIAGMHSKISVLGFPGRGFDEIPFNPLDSRYFYEKQLQLHAVGMSPEINDSRGFLKFNEKDNLSFILKEIARKNIDPNLIISGEKSWKEIEGAYKSLLSREGSPLTFVLNWEIE